MPYYNFGDITPSQIQIFLAAAEHENFSQAAKTLNITQPHVSHTVSTLEYLLGFPLFARSGKKVRLTPAGHVLYENWKGLFASISHAIDQAYQIHLQQGASLSVADKAGLDKDGYLYPILERFQAAYPDVHICVEQFPLIQSFDAVASGQIDMGFCFLSEIVKAKPTGIIWQILSSREYMAFVPPKSPLYSRDVLSPEALADTPIMLCDPSVDPHYNEDTLSIFRAQGLTPKVHSYAKDGFSLMLRRGLSDAVIILSPFSEGTGARRLRGIPIQGTSSSLVLYWNNSLENANISRFTAIAADYFENQA